MADGSFADPFIADVKGHSWEVGPISNAAVVDPPGTPQPTNWGSGRFMWWKYTPKLSGPFMLSTAMSTNDTEIGLYTGTELGSLTKVAADSDSAGGYRSRLYYNVVGGTTYWLQIGAYDVRVMDYALLIQGPAVSPGRRATFAGSIDVEIANNGDAYYDSVSTDRLDAALEPGYPHPRNAHYASAWWKYRPAESGPLTVATSGSLYHHGLTSFVGADDAAPLSSLALFDTRNTNAGNTGVGYESTVEAGKTYYFRVEGFDYLYNDLHLTVVGPRTRPKPELQQFHVARGGLLIPVQPRGVVVNGQLEPVRWFRGVDL